MPQFYPFSMISMELKAKIRRATRGHDENAVARQITRVFEENFFFAPKSMFSHQNQCFRTKIHGFAPKPKPKILKKNQTQIRPNSPHPPQDLIAQISDFDDLGHLHNDFSQRFRNFGPYGPISSKKRNSHEKYQNRAFWQHRYFGTKNEKQL